jgi:single-strand DNA-binding protein
MSNGINSIHLVGRLGQDPEVRYTANGKAVANLSIATTQGQDTSWHRVVVWEKSAEFAGKYLHKGDMVYVSGRLEYRKWEKNGEERIGAEIVAHTLQGLGSKDRGSEGNTEPPETNQPDGNVKQDDGFDQIPF